MKREDPIKNEDVVMAHSKGREPKKFKFGELKKLFLTKKIDYIIDKLYLPRKNKYYVVWYSPTKGFKFELVSWKYKLYQ